MANKVAKSGRFTFGEVDLESEWQTLANDVPMPGPQLEGLSPEAGAIEIALPAHPVAEAQLYAYLEASKEAARIPQTSPFEDLAERLNGFRPPRIERVPPRLAPVEDMPASAPSAPAPSPSPPPMPGMEWFDEQFTELRSLIGARENDAGEIVSINERLGEIVQRVDALAKSIPGEPVIQSIETQLANLAFTLNAMREAQSVEAETVAEAANAAASTAAERLERSREALERATGEAMADVARAAERHFEKRAAIAAGEIAQALQLALPERGMDGVERLEEEVHALNIWARESETRTVESIEKMHGTLRDLLHKVDRDDPPRGMLPPVVLQPLKRLGVHMPITAGVPAFSRSPRISGGQTMGASEASLKTLTSREPMRDATRPSNPASRHPAYARTYEPVSPPLSPVPSFLRQSLAAEEETAASAASPHSVLAETARAVPLLGVGAVALILLLASAALLYLKLTASNALPNHMVQRISSTPMAGDAEAAAANPDTIAVARRGRSAKGVFLNSASVSPVPASGSASAAALPPLPLLLQASPAGQGTWDATFQVTAPASATRASQSAPQPEAQPGDDDLPRLLAAASNGESEAEYRLGRRFLADTSIRSNASSAVRWLSRAANHGHLLAQYLLGTLYENGTGVARDDAQAASWYQRAAEAGHVKSMHNLAVLYTGQDDFPADYAKAATWFSRAAERGLADSQFNLAILYENGLGVRKDQRRAYFWFDIAGRGGDLEALAQAERLRKLLPAVEVARTDAEIKVWKIQDAPSAFSTSQGSVQAPG
jgi:localization factor PodJL